MKPEIEERLHRSRIEIGAQGAHYSMFMREGCLAMVPCSEGIVTGMGSTGLALDRGLAYLVYRDGVYLLAGHNFEIAAEPGQVEKVLQFSADLKVALGLLTDGES